MADDWRELSLADAGVQLIDCDHRTPPAAEGGYPYIAIPQLSDGRIELDGVRRISAEHFHEWTRKLKPRANDVIVVRRCNSGESAVVPDGLECAIGQNLVVLRSDGRIVHPEYLRWLVRGPEWWSEVHKHINVGAVFDSLKCRDIPNFRLKIPGLKAQARIAQCLRALDDRMENLRQTNATLEAIASALFKSWFIDFEGVPRNAMQESELGLIPMRWAVRSLDSIAEFLNGLALQKFPPESETNYLPVIKIAQLRTGNTVGADKASSHLKQEYIVDDGDVLFSWSGSLEVVIWTGGRGALNQHLFKVTSREVPKWFYYFATRRHLPAFKAIAAGKATTMGHIQRGHLTAAKVVVPPPDVMAGFDVTMAALLDQIIRNAVHTSALAVLRDSLLPRLVSGRLRERE